MKIAFKSYLLKDSSITLRSAILIIVYIIMVIPLNLFSQENIRNKSLHHLFDNYYEERLKLYPGEATAAGDDRYNDKLPNIASEEFRKQTHDFYSRYKNLLAEYKRESLSNEDKVSYDILKEFIEREIEGEKLHLEYIPFAQFFSLPLTIGQWGSGASIQPFKSVKDYENWLKRIVAFTVYVDTAIAHFNKGIKAGTVLPRALVLKMIPQMESLSESDLSKTVFYKPISNLPKEISGADKTRLTMAYQKAIATQIVPTYKKLANYFKEEYLPKSRLTSGVNSLPDGKAWYNYTVYFSTTTRRTPEEIYQTGLNEMARITTEMETLKNSMGYKGSLKELFEFMKTDKQFMPFKTEDEVLAANRAVLSKIEPHLGKLFSTVPKTPFEIKPVEAFRAAAAAPQYQRSSADGTRPGVYYIPILDATKINVTGWALESTFLHEAIPGHHYQISTQQENAELPKFRRFASVSAFSEGWALYTESLGKQLGCFTDPYQQMGAYGAEIHRAIRLVVDVALHTGKMTREEAIAYMLDHEALSEQTVIAEIERYMALPGQALSYKTGELEIKRLRDKYQKQLGDRFSLRSFHDAILKGGSMPLTVFETYMNYWAASQ